MSRRICEAKEDSREYGGKGSVGVEGVWKSMQGEDDLKGGPQEYAGRSESVVWELPYSIGRPGSRGGRPPE